ncbi:ribonuclease H-like domain-containing protein [Trichoderma barbatum]
MDQAASGASIGDSCTTILVDDVVAMAGVVDTLTGLPNKPPSIYVDLEGVRLSRYGSISILQLYIHPTRTTYLVDVLSLQHLCFYTPGRRGQTLKNILETNDIPKVFFDVRSDSDALYNLFNIRLAGVLDLQLLHFAALTHPRKKYVRALMKCVLYDSPLANAEKIEWTHTKEQGRALFSPEQGGSYEVLNERPLRKDIREYCTQDVYILPILWSHYYDRVTESLMKKVVDSSRERVWSSQGLLYNGVGEHMALAPLRLRFPDAYP